MNEVDEAAEDLFDQDEEENLERVLARVKRLGSVWALEGADRVQGGRVDGWETVVPLTYQPGDLGVFFEIDSVLPRHDEWVINANLADAKYIKTRKIRGMLSQGLFLRMDQLPAHVHDKPEGDNVTALLNVTKHAATPQIEAGPQRVRATTAGSYSKVLPLGPPKTDEIRIQSEPRLLAQLAGRPWVASLKLDGSSMTFFHDVASGALVLLSRNLLVTDPKTVYGRVAADYAFASKVARAPAGCVFQGEVYGPRIQANPLNVNRLTFAVFSVWCDGKYLGHDEYRALCKDLELPVVPEIARGDAFDLNQAQLLELAKGKYADTKNHREGLVIRNLDQGRRVSFKVINNDYLLKKASADK